NFVTILWCLFARWMLVFLLSVLIGIAADFYSSLGAAAIALELVLSTVFGVAYWVVVERVVTGFKPLPVGFCSLYVRARTVLEGALELVSRGLRRYPIHQRDSAGTGHPGRPPGFQRWLRYHGAVSRHYRRRLHAQ